MTVNAAVSNFTTLAMSLREISIIMKKKNNALVLFLVALLVIGGALYLLGIHETFGIVGASITTLFLTFLTAFVLMK